MSNLGRLTEIVARGRWGTVECVILRSGDIPATAFLVELRPAAMARFLNLFQQMADHGTISAKRFKKEMAKLFAFRHEVDKRQVRFPCFHDGNRWILTHGFIKPGAQKGKGAWPKTEIDRAQRIMDEYFQRKEMMPDETENG